MHLGLAAAAISFLLADSNHVANAAAVRPFTVADSIALTRLIEPDASRAQFEAPTFPMSPDGRTFVFVTRQGNLQTGRNEYALVSFDVAEVVRYINSRRATALPTSKVLVTFETSSHRHGIEKVRWLDGRTLAFIGRGDGGPAQVYSYSIQNRSLRKLTDHSEDIATFDLSLERGSLIYSAFVTPDWEARNTHGYAVKSEPLRYMHTKDPNDAFKDLTYFTMDLKTGAVRSVNAGPGVYYTHRLTLSPDASYAVAPLVVRKVPEHWTQYGFLQSHLERAKQALVRGGQEVHISESDLLDDDAFGRDSEWLLQFGLVDMKTGLAEPLLDAPAGWVSAPAAIWSADGTKILLATTYLPLVDSNHHDDLSRRRCAAIVEVEAISRRYSRVAEICDQSPDGHPQLLKKVEWLSDGAVVIGLHEYQGDELRPRQFRKVSTTWIEESPARPRAGANLTLSIEQGMNKPPEVSGRDGATGKHRIITQLNPQLRQLTLGRVEEFEWTDRLDRTYVGGLLFPPGYAKGTRYPVVIQTYGFRRDEFLVDGPDGISSAFAARAIANKGILVLQIPEQEAKRLTSSATGREAAQNWKDESENPRLVARLESAIDALDFRGLANRDCVGLIGWSRTAMHVLHAVTFASSGYRIVAATMADGNASTPWVYAMHYGLPYPGMLDPERLIGAPFWDDGIKVWLERSPAFHLHRIRSALRIEQYGTTPPGGWDTFAILKRHHRPVELIHIPIASHLLQTPHARYASQQGNVDWFAFWLKHEEDPAPAKGAQYVRWRKLRKQYEAQLGESPRAATACQ